MSHSTTPKARPSIAELLDFIAAVGLALDIPDPETDAANVKRYHEILERRTNLAARAIRGVAVVDPAQSDPATVRAKTRYLREWIAEIPATGYRHYRQPGGEW